MGVHGLWRLIQPSGRPVPLETLENKILAVDVSIWLHQSVKGFQDSKGAPLPNAHLLGIYHRVCKLLYFKIKPVFVFDGGVPVLKTRTISNRNKRKTHNRQEASQIQKQLLTALIKHSAIDKVLSDALSVSNTQNADNREDLYNLPPSQLDSTISSVEDESEYTTTTETPDSSPTKKYNLHTIDPNSEHFKSLPPDVRHDILTDLKETRKQNSWGKLHELPKQKDDFSAFQMRRLLKRQAVQTALEEAEKEMGGHSLSLGELESLLTDQGVIIDNKPIGSRIASNEDTRYLLIKDIKQAIDEAKKLETIQEDDEKISKNKGDIEFDEDLQKAIAMSLEDEPSTSSEQCEPSTSSQDEPSTSSQTNNIIGKRKLLEFSFLENFTDADFETDSSSEDDEILKEKKILSSAQSYMMEYSGLTPNEIEKIIGANTKKNSKPVSLNKLKKQSENVKEVESKITEQLVSTADKILQENESKISSSDEDSDFVDVEDCELIEISEEKPKETNENLMEIIVNPLDAPEDDLFSDIFVKDKKEETHQNEEIRPNVEETSANEEAKATEEPKTSEETKTTEGTEKNVEESEVVVKKLVVNETIDETEKNPVEDNLKVVNEMIPEKPKLSIQEMTDLKKELQKEATNLQVEKSTKERMAKNITDQMYQEAQELLELFGIPYIIAPMEAEAQCAYLNEINLTDGSITDDSDIWLFGGKTVYKNFFNQYKQVLEYRAENIQHQFKLTREQMILLALLVGSDYTIGIQGVGPVTALEILAAFPPANKPQTINLTRSQLLSGLEEFRSWFNRGCTPGPGRTALKNKLKNISFTENFPSSQVVEAYLQPTVDTNKEPFTWGKLDVIGLIDFAKIKFGWNQRKAEEILKPVLKRLEETSVQKSIKDYFKTNYKIPGKVADDKMSKRVKTAIDRIGKDPNEIEENEKKTKRTKRKTKDSESKIEEKKPKTKKDVTDQRAKTAVSSISKDIQIPPDQQKKKPRGKKMSTIPEELAADEDVKILKQVKGRSRKRVEEIDKEMKEKLDLEMKKKRLLNIHKKEVIPQKERDKSDILRSKLNAIEVFRKSKMGPGFVQKRQKTRRAPKDDAELSEESSSSSSSSSNEES